MTHRPNRLSPLFGKLPPVPLWFHFIWIFKSAVFHAFNGKIIMADKMEGNLGLTALCSQRRDS
jgi:hypothetical protein